MHAPILAARYCDPGIRERARLMPVRRFDEAGKQRMRPQRPRLELGMELHGQEPWMRGQLRDFDEFAVRRATRDAHALLGERLLLQAIEFEAMTMTLMHQRRSVDTFGERSWCQLARISTETHRPAELVHAQQIAQLVDHLVRCVLVYFRGIRSFETAYVARVLNGGLLEPVTDAKERHTMLAAVLGGFHHSACTARSEPARHEYAVRACQRLASAFLRERFRLHPVQSHFQPVREAAVIDGLVQALVGVLVARVLADDVDR